MPRNRRGPDPWRAATISEEKFSPMEWFTRSIVLLVANDLGVFECLSVRPLALDDIVKRLKTDHKGTRILLDALVGLRFLRKTEKGYENEDDTARLLTEDSPEYIGTMLTHSYRGLARWLKLEDLVRNGQQHKHNLPEFQFTKTQERRRRKRFAVGLDEASRTTAALLARKIDLRGVHDMLDLGGGAGAYSIAFAKRWPKLRPVLFEMPVTARVARKNIKAAGLQDRIRAVSGDFLEDNLGRDRYDAALVSNIVHIYGPDKNLETIKKVHCALRSGGRIIIKDLLVNDNRDGPFHPLMFGLTMLMFTDGGDTYTTAEITEWLREAGFVRIRRRAVITHESSMLIGYKK